MVLSLVLHWLGVSYVGGGKSVGDCVRLQGNGIAQHVVLCIRGSGNSLYLFEVVVLFNGLRAGVFTRGFALHAISALHIVACPLYYSLMLPRTHD